MLSSEAARDQVAALVELARRKGADAADAVYVGEASSAVSVRLGALEDVERSEGESVGLRVFLGRRNATVAASDLAPDTLDGLADRALAMAREAPEDPYAGLAPDDLLLREPPRDLDLYDAAEPDPAALRVRAEKAEDAARAVTGVTNSNGASASASSSSLALATSHGVAAATRASGHSCSASVVARNGGGMQRDYAWHSARHLEDLEDAAEIGRRAGVRAVARLGPRRIVPGPMTVLFDARVATSLLGHFIGAISGAAIARQSSFLLDALGTRVFADGVMIEDDPFRVRGLRSRAFDGECVRVAPRLLIEDGVLTGWIADSATARQLGIAPTGHAVRGGAGAPGIGPANLALAAGPRSRDEMIAGIDNGILVTELMGQGVNGVTGDYSRGTSGFAIRKGQIVHPVSEITIASNLKAMFATLEPASDLNIRRGIDSPTVLIPEMTVSSA